MNKKLKYPTRYELTQTFNDFCTRSFIDSFAQSHGIFISKAVQDEFSHQLSGFFYDNTDLEKIREFAHKKNSTNTLSGFIITSNESDFNPYSALDDLRASDKLPEGMLLQPITKDKDENGNDIFKGGFQYVEKKPGRIEFLQEETRSFTYSFNQLDKDSYQFLIECNKSTDSKVFENIVKKNTGKDVKIETLDSSALTPEQTNDFFDKLAKLAIDGEWRFLEVRKISIKKEDKDEETVNNSDLGGITQAILDGRNLRENSFVEQFVKNGYRFIAMTYEYEHTKKPFFVQIRAEFKSRPRVFEISVLNYKENVFAEGVREAELDKKSEMKMKIYSWKQAKEIYNSILMG